MNAVNDFDEEGSLFNYFIRELFGLLSVADDLMSFYKKYIVLDLLRYMSNFV